jgi:hypothetical protein
MNVSVSPQLLQVHADAQRRDKEVAAMEHRQLLQAGETLLPFAIHGLRMPRVAPVLKAAVTRISTLAGHRQRRIRAVGLPLGGAKVRPA